MRKVIIKDNMFLVPGLFYILTYPTHRNLFYDGEMFMVCKNKLQLESDDGYYVGRPYENHKEFKNLALFTDGCKTEIEHKSYFYHVGIILPSNILNKLIKYLNNDF